MDGDDITVEVSDCVFTGGFECTVELQGAGSEDCKENKILEFHAQASKQALYTHMHYIISAQKSNCNETVPQASVLLVTVN